MTRVTGYKTAKARTRPSAPMAFLKKQGALCRSKLYLDFGCGRGTDADYLNAMAYSTTKYDPYWFPDHTGSRLVLRGYDVVFCTYVLNVLPAEEREQVIEQIKSLLVPGGTAFITVRRDLPKEGKQGQGCYQYWVDLSDRYRLIEETSTYAMYEVRA